MNRNQVTEKIISQKVLKGMKWEDVAKSLNKSKEWTTACCLGQMTCTQEQARILGELFELTDEETKWLQVVPHKGTLSSSLPSDPLIYRLYGYFFLIFTFCDSFNSKIFSRYEIVNVYGTTIKELVHEEFGDGIISAIDFNMDIQRKSDPNGDRVNLVLSGKFLPYKSY